MLFLTRVRANEPDAMVAVNSDHVVAVYPSHLFGGRECCQLLLSTGFGTLAVLGSVENIAGLLQESSKS